MKMITIAPSYLANAKQQAYSVRDKISTSPFNEIYYSKSEFLDIQTGERLMQLHVTRTLIALIP